MASASRPASVENSRLATAVVALLMLAYIAILSVLVWLRYAAVHTDLDLAIYSQVVWNTAHGDWFRNSVLPLSANYLGNHFSPILLAFVPLYLIWTDPRVLLIGQVVVNALAVWPLYWFAREKLPTPWAGVLLVAAFLLYPALQHQDLGDFHGVALGTTVVMWAFFALLTGRNRLLFCILPLMVLVREDLSLVIVTMGLYAGIFQRRWRLGLVLCVLGIVLSILVILVLIPAFRGGESFFYNDYYDYLGTSAPEIGKTMLLRPGVWLSRAFHPPKFNLLLQLLLPVAFLPLLAPSVFLLGGSALAYLLLVDYPFAQIYTLDEQNQALLIPFIFFGAVSGLARLVRWLGCRWGARRVALAGSAVVLVTSFISVLLWGPLASAEKRAEFRVDDRARAEWVLLSRIPPDAGVVADDRLAAPLSMREGFFVFNGLFTYPYPLDYLVYEDTPEGYWPHPPALVGPPAGESWQVPRYELVDSVGLVELRRQNGTVAARNVRDSLIYGGAVALRGASGSGGVMEAVPGQPLDVALVWESLGPDLPRLVQFVHLIERQPEGEYRWASVDREPYNGLFPTHQWQAGDLIGDVLALEIPVWLAPGNYELHVGLYARDGAERLPLPAGGTTAAVTTVVIPPGAPAGAGEVGGIPMEVYASLARGLELVGQNPIPEQVAPGQVFDVTLFWRAEEPADHVYDLRFDLLGENESTPSASWTRPLIQGRFPNTEWPPQTIIADWHPLPLPADLSPGRYDLVVTALANAEPAGQPVPLAAVVVGDAE